MKYFAKQGFKPVTTGILLLFLVIFCLISLGNHYLFRTATFDLGMNTHALYDFAHFQRHHFTLSINYDTDRSYTFFGDHFSPIMFLYIPFYYLFGSYTLLVIQIFALLFGGLGVYRMACLKLEKESMRNLLLLQFFGIWGIYSALSFDFHNNVVGAMFVPWLFWCFDKRNLRGVLLFSFLIMISKENMALWLFFLLTGLYFRDRFAYFKQSPRILTILPLFVLAYFILVTAVIMPSLLGTTHNVQLNRFSGLGKTPWEMVGFILNNPRHVFAMLFESTDGSYFWGVKSEFFFMLIVSGGFLFFKKPSYLWMIIPLVMQKMLSSNDTIWSIKAQYSIEFAPLLSLAVADFASSLKSTAYRIWLIIAIAAMTWQFNIASIDYKLAPFDDPVTVRFYNKKHYSSEADPAAQHEALKLIPEDAVVSAHPHLVPHLCNRATIYGFPILLDATYVAIFRQTNHTFPMRQEDYNAMVTRMDSSLLFERIYDKNNLLILKRNPAKFEAAVAKMILKIRSEPSWFELIKRKAAEQKIPLDTMLRRDALYTMQHDPGITLLP